MTTAPTFAFNPLVQPSSSVTPTGPSSPDADMIYLLASATNAAVALYTQGLATLTPAMLAALPPVASVASYQQISTFTASEAIGVGTVGATSTGPTTTPGAFVGVPIGIALQALDATGAAVFSVIALRGTQTYQEWINDATALPQTYALVSSVGCVHAGFYSVYTTGVDGQLPTTTTTRVGSSLAGQVSSVVSASTWSATVPLYVTGHSLGAALAELCAMDLANNMTSAYSALTMVNFAPPRVSAGLLDGGQALAFDAYDPTKFQTHYQASVPDSYSVVNAADLVPMMPPTLGPASAIQLVFNPVVPTANVITYCAQLGTIGANHELSLNYLPYAQSLAAGFAAAVR